MGAGLQCPITDKGLDCLFHRPEGTLRTALLPSTSSTGRRGVSKLAAKPRVRDKERVIRRRPAESAVSKRGGIGSTARMEESENEHAILPGHGSDAENRLSSDCRTRELDKNRRPRYLLICFQHDRVSDVKREDSA